MIHQTVDDASVERMGPDCTPATDGDRDTSRHSHQAANLDLDEEISKAYEKLDQLYAKCLDVDDYKVALQVAKEGSRLLKWLDDRQHGDMRSDDEDRIDPNDHAELLRILDLIHDHLVPLGLAKESAPLQEHARVISAFVYDRLYESAE